MSPFLYKIKKKFKWEFAPSWVVYFPFPFCWLYWSWQARSFTFFTAANPGIYNGGLFGESKWEIFAQIPKAFLPITLYFPEPEKVKTADILQKMAENGLEFPIILKPDKGERGRGVAKIDNVQEITDYLQTFQFPFLMQSYIDFSEEYGILYHRLPNEAKGRVTSIVKKGFLVVIGDGKSTLHDLFLKNERCMYHYDLMKNMYQNELNTILPKEEKKILVSIGNHARGTTFLNDNAMISPALNERIDALSQQISGFYIGRFDLKANSIEEVCEGNFKIMELNGVGAEPGHIYAPDNPIWDSYYSLLSHWNNISKIARQTYQKGEPNISLSEFFKRLKAYQTFQRDFLKV
jgi:hypothetical protein